MKILKILIFFIALFLLAIVSIDKYSKFNQEKFRLKETLAGATRDGRVLKKEYDRELKERLRLKNRYDLTKDKIGALKESLQTELIRQDDLKKELFRKDKEKQSIMANYLESLKQDRKNKEELQRKNLELQKEKQELQKEKKELEQKNLELEKKFKNLEWISPEAQ